MKALIAGSSGLIGQELLRLLVAEPRVTSITAIGRRPPPLESERVQPLISDFGDLDAVALPASDVAFCCLGTTMKKAGSEAAFRALDHGTTLRFGAAARRSGARAFIVVTAQGADRASSFLYNRVKGEIERDLGLLGFESLVIARPSLLLGARGEKRLGESIAVAAAPLLRVLMCGPLARLRPIEARQVAQAMLRAAQEPRSGTRILSNAEMLTGAA